MCSKRTCTKKFIVTWYIRAKICKFMSINSSMNKWIVKYSYPSMFHFFLLVSSIFLLEHRLCDILYLGYAMKPDMAGNTSSHLSVLIRSYLDIKLKFRVIFKKYFRKIILLFPYIQQKCLEDQCQYDFCS